MAGHAYILPLVLLCLELCYLGAANKAALDNLLAQKELEVNRLFDHLNQSYYSFKCDGQVSYLESLPHSA
jgi:hypothetical protein